MFFKVHCGPHGDNGLLRVRGQLEAAAVCQWERMVAGPGQHRGG